jgi:hypothetical protein
MNVASKYGAPAGEPSDIPIRRTIGAIRPADLAAGDGGVALLDPSETIASTHAMTKLDLAELLIVRFENAFGTHAPCTGPCRTHRPVAHPRTPPKIGVPTPLPWSAGRWLARCATSRQVQPTRVQL